MPTTTPNAAVPLSGRTTQQETDPDTAPVAGAQGYATFADLGSALRSARKARNLSLEDVADTLKLSVSVLQALEEGNRDKFPHSAYAKGFLRSYAGYLKFDPESYREVLKIFTPEPELTEPVYAPDRSARPRMRTPWLGAVVSLLIACLIGWSVWHFQLLDLLIKEGNPDPQTTAPMQSSASASLEQSLASEQESRDAVPANPNQPAGSFSGIFGQVTQDPVLSGNMQTPAQATPGMPAGAGSVSSEGSPSKSLSLVEPGEREPLPAVVLPGSPWATLQGNATLAGEAGLAEPDPAAVNSGNSANPNLGRWQEHGHGRGRGRLLDTGDGGFRQGRAAHPAGGRDLYGDLCEEPVPAPWQCRRRARLLQRHGTGQGPCGPGAQPDLPAQAGALALRKVWTMTPHCVTGTVHRGME